MLYFTQLHEQKLKDRLNWVDYTKWIGITLVIYGHLPSGTGFKTSPAARASLVELILRFAQDDGAPKTVDIPPFRFERFAEEKLIEGECGYGYIWK